jgi:hypothetical protein
LKQRKSHIIPLFIPLTLALALSMFVYSCKTPKYTCPAYTEHKHRALADSTDPSNGVKQYYYYPVVDEGGGGEDTMFTSATNIEGMEDDSKTNEELLHENDLTKEKEEEWKPYTYFNIRMEVDSMGKPTAYKPVKFTKNGLVDKKKPKDINVDKDLADDKKKTVKQGYTKVEETTDEAPLPQ